MRLYAGRTTDCIRNATRNNIERRLKSAFVEHFRHRSSPAEIRSWEELLAGLGLVVNSAKLSDHGIFLEYQLSQNSREKPGEEFSGIEVMCLMHAGLRQVEPNVDMVMNLDDPYSTAKKLSAERSGKAR